MTSNIYKIKRLSVAIIVVIGLAFSPGSLTAAQVSEPTRNEDIQVLATGPIHEAFAEAVVMDPEPGLVVSKEPPAQIEEIPPDQKPEGEVQWIPGYWAWDDDKEDYIWISGIWRVAPPDRQWIPGYWNPVSNGYQWISGFWANNDESETTYYPEPPESVETGPNTEAPSLDHVWIPGCWVWHNGRYAWRPGYWEQAHEDWVWVPAHYSWTPRGYIYISGYWDFTVVHRGILFAPVFFPHHWRLGVVHHFSPFFTVNLTIFDDALFLRPNYRHYYFGDYYATRYYRIGILPWFSPHARRAVHDPIYWHQRWRHRHDRNWQHRLETNYQNRRNNVSLRPPRYYDRNALTERSERQGSRVRYNYVTPMRDGRNESGDQYRFRPLSDNDRSRFIQRETDIGKYRKERQSRENPEQENRIRIQDNRNKLDREAHSNSPIRSIRQNDNNDRQRPPARVREPGPNTTVEPIERQNRSSQSRNRTGFQENNSRQSNSFNRRNASNQRDRERHTKQRR